MVAVVGERGGETGEFNSCSGRALFVENYTNRLKNASIDFWTEAFGKMMLSSPGNVHGESPRQDPCTVNGIIIALKEIW